MIITPHPLGGITIRRGVGVDVRHQNVVEAFNCLLEIKEIC
jgi:hypothetical protein